MGSKKGSADPRRPVIEENLAPFSQKLLGMASAGSFIVLCRGGRLIYHPTISELRPAIYKCVDGKHPLRHAKAMPK